MPSAPPVSPPAIWGALTGASLATARPIPVRPAVWAAIRHPNHQEAAMSAPETPVRGKQIRMANYTADVGERQIVAQRVDGRGFGSWLPRWLYRATLAF